MIQLTNLQRELISQVFYLATDITRRLLVELLQHGEAKCHRSVVCGTQCASFWKYVTRSQTLASAPYTYTLDIEALFADKEFWEAIGRLEGVRRLKQVSLANELEALRTFRDTAYSTEPKENKTEPTDFI